MRATPPRGPDGLIRTDICAEGIRLARVLSTLMPAEAEARGLLALMLLQHSRREAGDTDWPRIAVLYARLAASHFSPVVELNRAVAVAMADGPAHGLALADPLAAELDRYHLFHSTRADLLRRLDRRDEAVAAYRRARELATNPVERSFLDGRIASLTR